MLRVEGPEQTEQFAQLAAIHQTWWESSIANSEDQVGSMVVFIPGMEEGNFHVQARSKLLVRDPEVVPTKALAEMQHDEAVKAPAGPPSLTGGGMVELGRDGRQHGQRLQGIRRDRASSAASQLRAQLQVLCNQTSSRREAWSRCGCRTRSCPLRSQVCKVHSQLTPKLFHEEISRRSYNFSTATIEEVDADPPTPPEDWPAWVEENVVEDAVADRPALSKVPHSAPAVGSTECSDQAAPTTAPQSFGPPAQTGQKVEAEVTVE